jgi:redox-sensitive bicupin YhaK (pirin superfamily)
MSNLEQRPTETECGATTLGTEPELLVPRDVPLGGPRAMTVRRTLPHRDRRMIGAWCFVDHYGPHDVTGERGMDVPPHPHTGLQTVSWLLEGEVLHRDSLGSTQLITPGQLNLMTAGRGIAHSEETPAERERHAQGLHGVQLWVALPDSARSTAARFEHHADLPELDTGGARVRVVMGALDGAASPATTHSPILGAEVTLGRGGALLPLEAQFEHGVLALDGTLSVDGRDVERGELLYLPPGPSDLRLEAPAPVRALLIGGHPFDERIVMWWNFVAADHDEIAVARAQWQHEDERFGRVPGYSGGRLPAPELPRTRLKARGRTRHI